MILIVDNTKRKMREKTRADLFNRGIPCVVATTESMDRFLPCDVIIVTERYIFEDAKYIADIYNSSCVILYEEKDLFDYALNIHNEKCLLKYYGRMIEYENGMFYFCSSTINFTKTEKRIIACLCCMPDWVSFEVLSAFCLKAAKNSSDSIAVHVCNINSKARKVTGHEIIECRRYCGYRLKR